jgi:hypothetical protein
MQASGKEPIWISPDIGKCLENLGWTMGIRAFDRLGILKAVLAKSR